MPVEWGVTTAWSDVPVAQRSSSRHLPTSTKHHGNTAYPRQAGVQTKAIPTMSEVPVEQACEFCPRCGSKSTVVGKVPFRCVECGFANFFGPVAAVGAIVTNGDGELLLVRRAKNPGKGQWGLPGGFVDRFETAEDAVAREVIEETNLRVTGTEFLMTYPNKYNYSGIVAPVIDLFFRCDVAAGEITLVDGELDDYAWVRPPTEQLDNMAFESNRIAIQTWWDSKS